MSAALYDLTPRLLARHVDAAFFRPAAECASLFACPSCDASAGDPCQESAEPHAARLALSGKAAVEWLVRRFPEGDFSRPSRAALGDIHGARLARAVEDELARKEKHMKPTKKRRTVRVAPPKRGALPQPTGSPKRAEKAPSGALEAQGDPRGSTVPGRSRPCGVEKKTRGRKSAGNQVNTLAPTAADASRSARSAAGKSRACPEVNAEVNTQVNAKAKGSAPVTPPVLQSRGADGRVSARKRSGDRGKKYTVTGEPQFSQGKRPVEIAERVTSVNARLPEVTPGERRPPSEDTASELAAPRPRLSGALERTLDMLIEGEPGEDPMTLLERVLDWLERSHLSAFVDIRTRLEGLVSTELKEDV